MTVSLHPDSPAHLYREILGETDAILRELDVPAEEDELGSAIATARNTFEQAKASSDVALRALDADAEWEALTIAMYGETNAGKSTLIETLRILMGEATKQAQRARFEEIRTQHGIDADFNERLLRHRTELERLEQTLEALPGQRLVLDRERSAVEEGISSAIRSVEDAIAALPWYRRLLAGLWPIPERVRLSALLEELEKATTDTRQQTEDLDQQAATVAREIEGTRSELLRLDAAARELELHQDGAIIGDGRSDFTRESTRYEFTSKGRKIVLLDVPGIEGKEALVREPIMQAVRKAHAVFYVTRKVAAPQKGDERTGTQGTLEKIKEHLGAQTEVWTIFNKSIKSPEQLRMPDLVNSGEIDSLVVLDKEMRTQLGAHYAGSLCVSAYPAFLASTDQFIPGNPRARDRAKFLAVDEPSRILQKTGLLALVERISSEMTENAVERIRRSNYNKALSTIVALTERVSEFHTQVFVPLSHKLEAQAHSSEEQLDSAADALRSRLESALSSLVRKTLSSARNEIYADIERVVGNDVFKERLQMRIESGMTHIASASPSTLEGEFDRFREEFDEIIVQFQEHIEDFMNDARIGAMKPMDYSVRIQIDSGINKPGLVGSLIAAAGTIVAMFTGPVGWGYLALSAAGIVASTAKAIWSAFDSDYRKSQQRKSADANLDRIFKDVRARALSQLRGGLEALDDRLVPVKESFHVPARQAGQISSALANATTHLGAISRKIVTEGRL